MKKVCNVFGIIFAVIFSLVLIPTLIVTPVWQGVTALLEPSFIEGVTTEIIEELDLSEISLNDPELIASLAEAGISQEAAQAILNSNTAHEAVTLLGGDFSRVLQGTFTTSALTEAELQRICTENKAELVELLRLVSPADTAALTDEQLAMGVELMVQEEGGMMIAELNQMFIQLQAELHNELDEVLMIMQSPLVLMVMAGIALVLALLVFVCRWPRQEGLMWLGIDCALAALPVLGLAVSLKGTQISQALSQGLGVPNVFAPVLRQMGNATLVGGAILAAAAVVFIALFILLRDRRMKKAAAHQYAAGVMADAPIVDEPVSGMPVMSADYLIPEEMKQSSAEAEPVGEVTDNTSDEVTE